MKTTTRSIQKLNAKMTMPSKSHDGAVGKQHEIAEISSDYEWRCTEICPTSPQQSKTFKTKAELNERRATTS